MSYDLASIQIVQQLQNLIIHHGVDPVSILYKSIADRYRPVRVADGPITTRYRFIKNTSGEKLPGFENTPLLLIIGSTLIQRTVLRIETLTGSGGGGGGAGHEQISPMQFKDPFAEAN